MATEKIKKPLRAVCAGAQTQLHGETSSASGDQEFTVTPTFDGMISVFAKPVSGAANEAILYLLQSGTLFTMVGGSKNSLIPFTLTFPVAKGVTYTIQTRRCNVTPGVFLEPFV